MGMNLSPDIIKYISIILCFLFALFGTKKFNFILLALFFTLIADYFLLFTDIFIFGVMFFILVQIFYLLNIINNLNVFRTITLLIFLFLSVNLSIYYFLNSFEFFYIFISIYISLSFTNIISYSYLHNKNPLNIEYILILVGIILLLICDIHVALYNLKNFILIENSGLNNYISISGKLIWIFYLPSQIFISIASKKHPQVK